MTLLMLWLGGLVALAVGGAITASPSAFYGDLLQGSSDTVTLKSELRAAGALILACGAVSLYSIVRRALQATALFVLALLFLSYATGRLLGRVLDGAPSATLVGALLVEVLLGLGSVWALVRAQRSEPAVCS